MEKNQKELKRKKRNVTETKPVKQRKQRQVGDKDEKKTKMSFRKNEKLPAEMSYAPKYYSLIKSVITVMTLYITVVCVLFDSMQPKR